MHVESKVLKAPIIHSITVVDNTKVKPTIHKSQICHLLKETGRQIFVSTFLLILECTIAAEQQKNKFITKLVKQ